MKKELMTWGTALVIGMTPVMGFAQTILDGMAGAAQAMTYRPATRATEVTMRLDSAVQRFTVGLNGDTYNRETYRAAVDWLLQAEHVMVGERFGSALTYEQYRSDVFRDSSYQTYRAKLMDAQHGLDGTAPGLASFGEDPAERRRNAERTLNLIHFYLGRCFFELATRWSRSGTEFGWGTVNDASLAEAYLRVFVSGFEGARETFKSSPWPNLYREQLSMYADAQNSLTILELRRLPDPHREEIYTQARRAIAANGEALREGCRGVIFYRLNFLRNGTTPVRHDFGTKRSNDWDFASRINSLSRLIDCKTQSDSGGSVPACRSEPSYEGMGVF